MPPEQSDVDAPLDAGGPDLERAGDVTEQLMMLQEMLGAGEITEAEYETELRRILDRSA